MLIFCLVANTERLGHLIGQNVPTIIIIEMVQLRNPTQSSTVTEHGCRGNKCPASAAIDGDYNTGSVTDPGSAEWWQVEMMKTVLIDHIMIHTSDYAMGQGYFDR